MIALVLASLLAQAHPSIPPLDLPVEQYHAQRDVLNPKGIYLVNYAIECGAPDPKDTQNSLCPPTGAQLTTVGWWVSRERILALGNTLVEQERRIGELESRAPAQTGGPSFFHSAKWFGIGLLAGGIVIIAGAGLIAAAGSRQK
jgi:hypothetical protein